MIDQLLTATQPDGEGWVQLLGTAWEESDARLRLHVSHGEQEGEGWEVLCTNLRSQRVGATGADQLSLESDHVLLWPHLHVQSQLLFRGAAADPRQLIGALHAEHDRLVGRWFAFDEFLNPEMPVAELLSGAQGTLAVGPHGLLLAYKAAAEKLGMTCALVQTRKEEEQPPKALLLGESWWVAEAFSAVRTG